MRIVQYAARAIHRLISSLSGVGIVLGTLFFAAALTPTLIPRNYLTQGILAGSCFALGYLGGVFWHWLWHYLELPEPSIRTRIVVNRILIVASLIVAVIFLWRAADWQNSIRAVMSMEPVETAHPLKVCAIALLTFLALLILGRTFGFVTHYFVRTIRRFIPRRIANVAGVLIAVLVFWSIADNLLLRTALRAIDASFKAHDALLEPDRAQPTESGRTGSAASLVRWAELGRMGREYIASGPSAEAISAMTGRSALQPIRVYVGLRGGDTAQARAQLALDELKRQGGFERSILVVVTPTGSGWIDPAAMDTIEYLQDGNIASVAMQYSYLNSPLSLLVEPEYGADSARALFAAVYKYWTTLPKAQRPKLFVHGLSLGAVNSEKSAELFEMLGDPIAGALWSGPPFASWIWRNVTYNRNAGSPEWLPEFRDSRFVRFMNQNGSTVPGTAPWGALRVVYLQYASDPITFFSYAGLYQRPAWMNSPRGPDVSPELQWYPFVTMLQLALDMAVSMDTPMGYGHVFAPEHYVDGWKAVVDIQHWSPDALAKLKLDLAAAARKAVSQSDSGKSAYDNRGG